MERNLTTGSVFKNVIFFSLPYLLSYFLQTLYGMADLFIIGQFDGTAATTAVSIGSQVMHMLTVMIVGLAMGTTVSVGQAVGGSDRKRASKCVGNTVTLFFGVSVALTAVLLLLVRPIVSVMSTPAEAVNGTIDYLTVCFIGIPFITAYNIISSVFRGMGDSKSPMYFIAVACAANIALDYLFMGAQNIGANKPERAEQTLRYGILLAFGFGVIVSVIIQFVAEPVVGLFNKDPAVITAGGQYLRGYILDCAMAGIHFCFSGYFCACGRSGLSFLHNVLSLTLARVPGAYLMSKFFPATLFPMGLATAVGSLVSVIVCVIAFAVMKHRSKIKTEA